MSLMHFLDEHREALIDDWTEYARALQPQLGRLSQAELRNSASEILDGVITNMQRVQSDSQQEAKSLGVKFEGDASFDAVSMGHADERRAHGFSLDDVVAEFRALRASVLRRWQASGRMDQNSFQEMIRFNEAIDQALSESIQQYSMRVERARDLFTGVLAHDLRAPLGILQNAAEILLRDDSLSASSVRATAYAQRAVLRMRTLIDDLLTFTRNRLDRPAPTHLTSQSMQNLCSAAIEETRVVFPEASITLTCRGNSLGTWDAGQINQLLSNLLSNAARYGDGSVSLSIEDQGELIEIKVSNGGKAVPPSAIPTLFDPLTRATPNSERRAAGAGLGLGLFICRSIVTSHQGTIKVESDSQQTTFTVRLPRSPQQ